MTGYEQDDQLVLVSVRWQPAESAGCTPTEPLSACAPEPSEQIYTIALIFARR